MRRVYSVVLSLVCLTALCNVWLYTRVAPTQLARQNNEGGPLGLLPPPPKGSVQPRKTKDVEYKDYLSVCTVFKNEGAYLEEWIRFHTVVGVTRFYLYDDASTDDSRAVLRPFVQSGLVRVHNVQDVHVRDDKEYRMAQTGSFKHCLREYSTETQWMMFIDVDEFLFPSGGGSLPAVLALYEDHPGLVVRGLVFGSTRHVTRPSGLVIENYLLRAEARHPTFAEKEDDVLFQVKSIVNPRLAMPCQGQSHYFCYVSGEAVNERFEIHNTTTKGKAYIDAIRYNHYKAKSYSDYLAKKDKGVVQGKHTGKFLKAGNQWVNLDINDVYDDLIWQHYGEVLRDSFPSAPSPSIIPDASTSSTRVRMCSKPATIVVLGMHHSATSVLARMIRHMGAYGGEMTEFELAPGPNPSKYWERRDLCEANHNVLIPQTTRGPWYMGMGFNVSAITPAQEDTFMMQATKAIERTRRSGGVHFLKDPRMCLTMAMWRPLLLQDGNPLVCVIPYRHPMHVASSIVGFKGQTDGLNISDALLVWEKYHVSALKACQGLPTILVRQDEMLHDPYGAMLRLHRDWTTIIAPPDMDHATMNALTPPDRTFIMQNIYNARKEKTTSNVTDDDSMLDRMRPSAAQLFASLWSGSALGKDYGPWGTPTLMHGEAHNTDTHRAEEKHLPRYLEHIRFWTFVNKATQNTTSGEIVAMYGGQQDLSTIRDAVCTLRHLGLRNFVVLGFESELCEQLRNISVVCWSEFDEQGTVLTSSQTVARKMEWIRRIVTNHRSLFIFDPRVIMLRHNPLVYLAEQASLRAAPLLLVAREDDAEGGNMDLPSFFSSSMMYFTGATTTQSATLALVDRVIRLLSLGQPEDEAFRLALGEPGHPAHHAISRDELIGPPSVQAPPTC